MKSVDESLNRVEFLAGEYAKDLSIYIEGFLISYPAESASKARDDFFLRKIATLVVGMEVNRRRIEEELNELRELVRGS